MNRVTVIGRLAADPEIKETKTLVPVTGFTIAVDRPFSKGSDRQTDWIDIVAWRNTAEFVCKYFHKGDPIVVEGSIQTRRYTDKDGKNRTAFEVVANNVQFVESKRDSAAPVADTAAFSNNIDGDFSVIILQFYPYTAPETISNRRVILFRRRNYQLKINSIFKLFFQCFACR